MVRAVIVMAAPGRRRDRQAAAGLSILLLCRVVHLIRFAFVLCCVLFVSGLPA